MLFAVVLLFYSLIWGFIGVFFCGEGVLFLLLERNHSYKGSFLLFDITVIFLICFVRASVLLLSFLQPLSCGHIMNQHLFFCCEN